MKDRLSKTFQMTNNNMEIVINISPTHRKVYRFYLSGTTILFDDYLEEKRETTRHGWKTIALWMRIPCGRNNDHIKIEKPELPEHIAKGAIKMYAEKLTVQ